MLSGELRSFAQPQVHGSIRANVIDALCPSSSVCTAHVFACPSKDQCPPNTPLSRSAVQLRAAGATSHHLYTSVLRNFSAGGLVVDTSPMPCADLSEWLPPCFEDTVAPATCAGFSAAVRGRCNGTIARLAGGNSPAARLLNETMSPSNASTTGNIGAVNAYRCFLRVVAHERTARNGTTFDWVVRLRFDVAFFEPLPPLDAFATRAPNSIFVADNHERTFADQFALIARRHASAYFEAAVPMRCCTAVSRCVTMLVGAYYLPHSPEQALQASLWAHAARVRFGYVAWVLVRQLGRAADVAANCYVQLDCCASHGKSRAFGHSCWPPCPSAEERLARCTALLGRSKSCVNVTNKPTGVERATRAHVAGRDFNRVDVCDLKRAPRARPGA